MRVSMLTCGTRGDTQPLVVLGTELRRRGHDVVDRGLAQHPRPASRVRLRGAAVRPGQPGAHGVGAGPALAGLGQRLRLHEGADGDLPRDLRPLRRGGRAAVEGADVVVGACWPRTSRCPWPSASGAVAVTAHSVPVAPHLGLPAPAGHDGPAARLGQLRHRARLRRGVVARATSPTSTPTGRGRGCPRVGRWRRWPRPATCSSCRCTTPRSCPGCAGTHRRPLTGFLAPDDEIREAAGESGLSADLGAWLEAGDPRCSSGSAACRCRTRPPRWP